jgi:hypothetical protein
MSINQSQPRMRLHPVFLRSQNHRKGTSPLIFGPCRACVFAACLTGSREACLHPRIPNWRRVYQKHRASFHILHPQIDFLPTHSFMGHPHHHPHTASARQFRRASALLSLQLLKSQHHAAAGKRFIVDALKKEPQYSRG